jgi:endonuclease/exonuclease/phosphatase family metal-dependent hydrolase
MGDAGRFPLRGADEDLGHVAEVIDEIAPQIVALQEIRDAK